MKTTSPAPRSVTMEDAARDAGVSRALVSLVVPKLHAVSWPVSVTR